MLWQAVVEDHVENIGDVKKVSKRQMWIIDSHVWISERRSIGGGFHGKSETVSKAGSQIVL